MAKFALGIVISLLLVASGYSGPTGRVVGGVNAVVGQFPHQVSLRRNGFHTCGGSILSQNYILTAAHCVNKDYPAEFSIRAGSNDRLMGGVVITVQKIIVHEDYGDFLNDVALLRLEKPLIFSSNIKPIELALTEVPSGKSVIISGWGRTKHGGDIPQKLQWNTLTAISRSECNSAINWDSDALICLAHDPNNGACNGDSGGPATYNGKLVGVAGFVVVACGTQNPDGYASVPHHSEWITANSRF